MFKQQLNMFYKVGLICLIAISILSCEKEEKQTTTNTTSNGITFNSTGNLSVNFEYFFKNETLKFSPDSFVTKALDTIKITDLTYYVSNITLTKSDGSSFNIKNYSLVKATNPTTLTFSNIPAGNYKKISFMLGVDTPNNHTLNHAEPDLDPSLGMSWGWSTGYIFTRIKGYYSSMRKAFSFDLGGDDNLLKLEFDITNYTLSANQFSVLFKVDVNEFFENPNTYDLKTQVTDIHIPNAPEIQVLNQNISNGMFKLQSIQ